MARLSGWVLSQYSRQLAAYSGKPDLGGMPNRERTIAYWEWRDGGSSVYPPYWENCHVVRTGGVRRWGTVLSGGACLVPVLNDPSEG